MKLRNYLIPFLLILATSCQPPTSDQKKQEQIHNGTIAENKISKLDSTKLIIAGKGAGELFLGQDMQDVIKKLGHADDGDAAMGSAVGVWYTNSSADTSLRNPITIFSTYRDSNMVIKVIKQLSISAPEFSTTQGIHTGVKLKKLQSSYPSLKKAERYINEKNKDTLAIYDDLNAGIAFDIHKDTISAITIHPRKRVVNSTYLTVHPGWKRVM